MGDLRPVAHGARYLGIHKEVLWNWVRQAEADQGGRPDLLTTAERNELAQLRNENAELRRANEIMSTLSPSDRQRRIHLWVVGREMPISAATCATGRPERTRAISSRLP